MSQPLKEETPCLVVTYAALGLVVTRHALNLDDKCRIDENPTLERMIDTAAKRVLGSDNENQLCKIRLKIAKNFKKEIKSINKCLKSVKNAIGNETKSILLELANDRWYKLQSKLERTHISNRDSLLKALTAEESESTDEESESTDEESTPADEEPEQVLQLHTSVVRLQCSHTIRNRRNEAYICRRRVCATNTA